MERLTKRRNGRVEPAMFTQNIGEKMDEKLADYEDAEENRSLIKFPVGLGQKIYFLLPAEGVVDAIVGRLEADEYGIMFMVDYLRDCDSHRYSMYFSEDDIGRDVFLTKEDAEKRLEELES